MDPSKRVALFLLVAAAIFSCSPKRQRAAVPRPIVAPPSHPNVLLIVIDTLRHDDSGVGSPSASSTSTLQRLASRAVMFDHSYSTFDETIHSHFSLLTGFVRGSGTPLDHPENAMAMQLKRVGYTTIGVAANGNLAGKILPVVRGFDRYTCMYDQWYPLPEKQQATFLPEINARIDAWHGRHDPWNQFMIFSNAGRVMERLRADIAAARQPFFAFVNLMETHDPYFPDPAIDSPEADGKAGVPAGFDADMRFRTIPPKYADGRLATRAMRRVIAEDL
ncbi:MAG: sulfatase-like hydrolase/transferase, partial [Thermoanaerobaculia bacterium]